MLCNFRWWLCAACLRIDTLGSDQAVLNLVGNEHITVMSGQSHRLAGEESTGFQLSKQLQVIGRLAAADQRTHGYTILLFSVLKSLLKWALLVGSQ